MRVGLGYDVHPFGSGEGGEGTLVLGGVTIEGPGLAGHSDADALAHAVADALLGPAGLPDLGAMFPTSDERVRDADSMQLLREVATGVAEAGWRVVNVDIVIAAQRPKLAPHVEAMCTNLRAALAAVGDDVHVSITPKHGEGLDAVGRGEGIAVWALALLQPTMRS